MWNVLLLTPVHPAIALLRCNIPQKKRKEILIVCTFKLQNRYQHEVIGEQLLMNGVIR